MSGLFESLTSASNAMDAQRMGIDVVGQNLANVNTAGYSRRTLILGELPPTDPMNAGRGVEVLQVQAQRDLFVEDRLRKEQASGSFTDAQVQSLSTLQAGIGLPGAGLDAQIGAFFDAFSTLANDVTSPSARDGVVAAGKSIAQTFDDLTNRIAGARTDADNTIRGAVDQINTLASQVAALNNRITGSNGVDVESLRDQRSVLLTQLSQIAGVTVTEREDGPADVSIGQGLALVVGKDSFHLDVASSVPSNLAKISIGGADITSELNQGQIGGLLQVRDTILPGYSTQLDQLAYDISTQVNALHTGGVDANGNPAGNFFVQPGAVAGAASSFAVDPALAADSRLVAGGATAASGDNQIARAIAGLRDSRVMSGGTATAAEAWGQFVYHVGADISSAQSASDTHAAVTQQLQTMRDSASAVSMDEEAAWLMKYQSAYQASARYFQTVNTAIDTLMGMLTVVA